MTAIDCFETDELNDYLLGNLSEEVATSIEQHLAQCIDCEDTINGLDGAGDTLVMELARAGNPLSFLRSASEDSPADPCFEKAMNAISERAFDFEHVNGTKLNQRPGLNLPSTIGDYEIISELARGGMGNVFLAKHTVLDKTVAIKVLSERRQHRENSIARFTREMQIIGKMNHSSIVAATDAGEVDGIHFLVMELVDGWDLSRTVRSLGPLKVADACELIRQSAIGLQYAHEQGVTHRDVKPANLMLCRDGSVKILDLGLATLSDLNSMAKQLTTAGQLMGTLDYMAPEQCAAQTPADARSDVYGLGATLYKLLTAKAPYSTDNKESALSKMKALTSREPTPILQRDSSIPEKLADIVDHCLSREPDSRFQSAAELALALAPFAKSHDLGQLCDAAQSEVNEDCEPSIESEVEHEFRLAAAELRSKHVAAKTAKRPSGKFSYF